MPLLTRIMIFVSRWFRARLLLCWQLEEKYRDQLDALKLIFKPSRGHVIAKQSFPKGQLTLVPATPKIVVTDQPSVGKIDIFGRTTRWLQDSPPARTFVGPDKDGDYKDCQDCFLPPFWADKAPLMMLTKPMLNSSM